MNLNSHILKLTGSAELSGALELGKRYAVGIEVGITDERKVDNEDQTFSIEYKAKLIRAEVKTDLGTLKTRDKTHQSAKTRFAILSAKNNYRPELDDEVFYDMIQQGVRSHLPEIINMVLKK